MKKLLVFLSAAALLMYAPGAYAQLKVSSTGNVGINNNSPAFRLDVEGTARFSNWTDVILNWNGLCGSPVIFPERDWYLQLGTGGQRIGHIFSHMIYSWNIINQSDENMKTDIADIDDPMAKITGLVGKQYHYAEAYLDSIPDTGRWQLDKLQYGFIAQEVASVIPDVVSTDPTSGLMGINYVSLVPVLTEGIKIQQNTLTEHADMLEDHEDRINDHETLLIDIYGLIDELGEIIGEQEEEISLLSDRLDMCCPENMEGMKHKNRSEKLGAALAKLRNGTTRTAAAKSPARKEASAAPMLFQNAPNPFNETTEIKYTLPSSAKNASMLISNMSGEQLASYKLTGTGTQSLKIDGGNMKAGSYFYTLIVDGKEAGTKKMILFK